MAVGRLNTGQPESGEGGESQETAPASGTDPHRRRRGCRRVSAVAPRVPVPRPDRANRAGPVAESPTVLTTASGAAVMAGSAYAVSVALTNSRAVGTSSRAAVRLPPPADPAPPRPAGVTVGVAGIAPFITRTATSAASTPH